MCGRFFLFSITYGTTQRNRVIVCPPLSLFPHSDPLAPLDVRCQNSASDSRGGALDPLASPSVPWLALKTLQLVLTSQTGLTGPT